MLLIILILNSCTSKLDVKPISDPSVENFYRNQQDFEQAVNAAYNGLGTYPTRHFFLSEIRSDNMYVPGDGGTYDWNPVNNFIVNASNTLMSSAWSDCYNTIMRCNSVLDNINEQKVPDQAARDQLTGEAKFIRALMYFDLVRFFGAVPKITKLVGAAEAQEIARSPVSEIYDVIIADLESASQLLPDTYSGAAKGRATRYAAAGLLARVYLTRSGPVLFDKGPVLNSNEYGKARDLLRSIINSGKYAFISDYAQIFSYDNENNSESLFEVQFKSGGTGTGTVIPAEMLPTVYMRAAKIPVQGGNDFKFVSNDLLQSYPVADMRLAFNILQGYTDEGGNFVNQNYFKKFLDPKRYGVDLRDWGINQPVLRYTDVLMMYAETLLHTGGSQAEADSIVNMVRTRAGLPAVNGVNADQLLEERRREFAAEGLRWHDLVRTGKVVTVMNAWMAKEDERHVMKPMQPAYILYPIPQTAINIRPGLYEQNEGYN
jgi:SusD family.